MIALLMVGGAFLCYEGAEKLAHKMFHRKAKEDKIERAMAAASAPAPVDPVALEKDKIKGAIRTDFVLSAEIIVITLGTVAGAALPTRVAVLAGVAVIMTIGVYGTVAAIVKLDDGGLYLSRRTGDGLVARMQRNLGFGILKFAPWLMKGLAIVGTAAMFLVGGGILVHGIPVVHHWIEDLAHRLTMLPSVGGTLETLAPILLNGLAGIVAGSIILPVVTGIKRLIRPATAKH